MLERFEDRIVPAFNLELSTGNTTDVSQVDAAGVRTFTATADDAVLNLADIMTAFQAGQDVVVSTGSGGGGTGNITWESAADLDIQGLGKHSLTLQTDAGDSGREITIYSNITDNNPAAADQLTLKVLTGGADGFVFAQNINTGGGALQITSGSSGICLDGNELQTGGGSLTLTGNVSMETGVTMDTTRSAFAQTDGALSIFGTVDGEGTPESLTLNSGAGVITLGGDLGAGNNLSTLDVNGTLQLTTDRTITVQTSFTLDTGLLDVTGTNTLTINTGTFQIGDGLSNTPATLTGTGTVHAASTIQVASNGAVAPGGVNVLGSLTIDGSIEFQDGSQLLVDLGPAPDQLHVTGSATLDSGALLEGGSGLLSGPGSFTVLAADGGLTGTFANTAGEIVLGFDAVTVSYTSAGVQISQVAAGPNTVTGAAADGTLYSVRLTAGADPQSRAAQLVVIANGSPITREATRFVTVPVTIMIMVNGQDMERTIYRLVEEKIIVTEIPFEIVVRNSTPANQLLITTTPNGGANVLNIDDLEVTGDLGAIRATTTSLGQLQVSGFLGRLNLRSLTGDAALGGTQTRKTNLSIGTISGNITTTSSIGTLASNEVFPVQITAPSIQRITVTANSAANLSGDFSADLILSSGSSQKAALGTANIAGSILAGTWDIQGTIGSVTVGNMVLDWSLGSPAQGFPVYQLGDIRGIHLGDVLFSSITSAGKINRLTAASWYGGANEGTLGIEANTLNRLTIAGLFGADLVLGAAFSTTVVLNAANIGSLSGSTWDILGSIRSIIVHQTVYGWNLGTTGGGLHPDQLGNIQTLRLGSVQDSSLFSTGTIGLLSAASWVGSSESFGIQALTIRSLSVAGNLDNTDLTLDAGTVSTALALNTATIGGISSSQWNISGSLGQVTVRQGADSWTLGTGDLGNIRSLNIGGQVTESAVQAGGDIGSIAAQEWNDTDITANSLSRLTIRGDTQNGVAGDFSFSTVTLAGASGKVGLGKVQITGSVSNCTFNVEGGDVSQFQCGRFQSSNLYVGYIPPATGGFLAAGTFTRPLVLVAFATTARPLNPPHANPLTDAFQNSQIVANRFGRVHLTGVSTTNSFGLAFGLRVNGANHAGKVLIDTLPFTRGVLVLPPTTRQGFNFLAS